MRRIRLVVQYKGNAYAGWQVQDTGIGVQEVIEHELFRITGENIKIHASGRTDASVHALAQVVHFDTNSRIPAAKFPYALNVSLPPDIRIIYGDEPKNPEFHARFDAISKHYRYVILNTAHNSAFHYDTALHIYSELDRELLVQAANQIIGTHDFHAFMATGTSVKSTVREIFLSKWTFDNNLLIYDIEGSGFLYNMVRIIVGTMLDIARRRLDISCIQEAFQTGDRSVLGATAPAHGLFLTGVRYNDFNSEDYIDVQAI